jgi:hypothetical protein
VQYGKELGQGLEEVNFALILFPIATDLRVAYPQDRGERERQGIDPVLKSVPPVDLSEIVLHFVDAGRSGPKPGLDLIQVVLETADRSVAVHHSPLDLPRPSWGEIKGRLFE